MPVDIIRTVAIVAVIFLHATNDLSVIQMNLMGEVRWLTVDVYQSIGRIGVPLFVMLTGALLLQPGKNESLTSFFKKRWARIGLPWIFWSCAYFAWDFLVEHQAFTSNAIVQGVLSGPYFQFWYLYMLLGLYLLTPILRILLAHAERGIIKYFIVLWFLGASILPFVAALTPYSLDSNVLTITGYVGYYVLGVFLLSVQIRKSILYLLMCLGVALTSVSIYIIESPILGNSPVYTFTVYFGPATILTSVVAFLLLNTYKTPSQMPLQPPAQVSTTLVSTQTAVPHRSNRLLSAISQNTLPIFLFHVMILESLQKGYFGFAINGNTVNSIIGVPLITVLTLFICLGIILALKKIPYLKRLIG